MQSSQNKVLYNWKYNWFGLWADPGNKSFPTLAEITDPNWFFPEKLRLIEYLKSAPAAIVFVRPRIKCSFCGEETESGSCWQSDNVWLWPCFLAHFVEKHHWRLPNRMVEHIISNEFKPPTEITVPLFELPWPPIEDLKDEGLEDKEEKRRKKKGRKKLII